MIKKLLIMSCFLLTVTSTLAQEGYGDFQQETESFSEQITLYPNPVTEKLIIANDSESNLTVTIYNILGDPMITKNIKLNKSYIDVMSLPVGVYIVSLTDGKRTTTERLVKN